jgi:HlyD family secretion protein
MRPGAGAKYLLLCTTFGAAAVAGLVSVTLLPDRPAWIARLQPFASSAPRPEDGEPPPQPAWVASAPGRVEPESGEVRIDALVPGRVAEVLVGVNDRVGAGDLIARLEDEEARARLAAAEARVLLRKRERDDAPAPKGALADLRKAEDRAADAERTLASARHRHDRLVAGRGPPDDLAAARTGVAAALRRLASAREDLARRKAATARTPGPRDLALAIARADLAVAEALFEKTRLRAPLDGTVLQVHAHPGEAVGPQRLRPIVVLADLSRLRVRADLDERNRAQVVLGQPVLVRSESFAAPSEGKVAAIAPALVPAQTAAGSRRRPQAGSVVEVLVEIADPGQLMPGMQVDVYFLAPPMPGDPIVPNRDNPATAD